MLGIRRKEGGRARKWWKKSCRDFRKYCSLHGTPGEDDIRKGRLFSEPLEEIIKKAESGDHSRHQGEM